MWFIYTQRIIYQKKDTVAPMPETITHKSSQKNTIKSSKPEKTILT